MKWNGGSLYRSGVSGNRTLILLNGEMHGINQPMRSVRGRKE